MNTGGTEKMTKEIHGLPELMRFSDGGSVAAPEDWERRRGEILSLYAECVYGSMPDPAGETIAYALSDEPATGKKLMTVAISARGRSAKIAALISLPWGDAPAGGFPFFLEYMPWHYQDWFTGKWITAVSPNCTYAAGRGYAGIQYDPARSARDDASYTGAFYTLYPYDPSDPAGQRGVLLAWAWGVSKILDALEAGAGAELGINPALSVVGGVSRFGKSAAVAGAYDPRIRVTVPACSGLGGVAVFRTDNSGKAYDLTSLGGPRKWVNESKNEPLSNLQGGEGYWFCGSFARFPSARALPVDQHMLCALMAGRNRHLIIVTGITSEGWNNTEGQCLAFAAARPAWELMGCGDQISMLIHLDGHAILPGDLQSILAYCDERLLGRPGLALPPMKGELFLQCNRDVLDPYFEPYLK